MSIKHSIHNNNSFVIFLNSNFRMEQVVFPLLHYHDIEFPCRPAFAPLIQMFAPCFGPSVLVRDFNGARNCVDEISHIVGRCDVCGGFCFWLLWSRRCVWEGSLRFCIRGFSFPRRRQCLFYTRSIDWISFYIWRFGMY